MSRGDPGYFCKYVGMLLRPTHRIKQSMEQYITYKRNILETIMLPYAEENLLRFWKFNHFNNLHTAQTVND